MHPYLTRLGIRPEVQDFFSPFFSSDQAGNLVFSYRDSMEHFGFGFHRVPVSNHLWIAGNNNFFLIRHVVICASAMDAIAWLNLNYYTFLDLDNLLFLSLGASLKAPHIQWISENLPGKTFTLIFSKDILGRLADLKIAAGIRRMPVAVYLSEKKVLVSFRFRDYAFQPEGFSLNAFEKAAKYRFHISTGKPKAFDCYFDQLKANLFPTH